MPGQQAPGLSQQEIQNIARKQELLLIKAKWEEFLGATTPEEIAKTTIAKDILSGNLPPEALGVVWIGAKQIQTEQTQALVDAGKSQDLEDVPLMVHDVMGKVVAIMSGDPRIISTSTFRAFVLAVQLGIIQGRDPSENQDNSPDPDISSTPKEALLEESNTVRTSS